MSEPFRYCSVGCSFYGLTQQPVADILDFKEVEWSETQLVSDMHNKVLPMGLLIMDIVTNELFEITKKKGTYGWRQCKKAFVKEIPVARDEEYD